MKTIPRHDELLIDDLVEFSIRTDNFARLISELDAWRQDGYDISIYNTIYQFGKYAGGNRNGKEYKTGDKVSKMRQDVLGYGYNVGE